MLADAYRKDGQTEDGLRVITEELARVQKIDVRFYEAELHRVKGELLLAQEGKSEKAKGKREEVLEAEACFQKAFDIAQSQRAKTLELRAVMSLSRLWQQHGKKDEARQKLAEIYDWFTEGFDTADLKETKAMLEELT
jgi:predicted ATPase